MEQIKHHLNDPLLMSYAAGTLPEAFNLVVATHISMCDECRARLGAFEAVGGALLHDADGALPDVDFDATVARIANTADTAPKAHADTSLPAALQDYIGGSLEDVQWRAVGMGVRQAILPTSKDASVRLLSIPAGVEMPDHGHRGMELTLVLRGAFRDEQDRFAPGDIEIASEADQHTPTAEMGGECICLAATDAPLKFTGLLQRIAQPFLRI